jgi:small subunit ribosomal protein S17
MAEESVRNQRKQRTGVVVSDAMNKTVVVQVEMRRPHPLYRKVVKQFKKFYVHDEENAAKVGDEVTITECRPLSKTKRWRLEKVHASK